MENGKWIMDNGSGSPYGENVISALNIQPPTLTVGVFDIQPSG
jgi:hypothetical protein